MTPAPDDLPEQLRGRTPDEVLGFLRSASDDELLAQVRDLGVPVLLELVFGAWAQRIDAKESRGAGVLVFVLDDEGVTHRHGLALGPGGATAVADPPQTRASVSTSVLRFLRVAAGAADPKLLVLTGRLRLGGDVVWAVATLAGLQQR